MRNSEHAGGNQLAQPELDSPLTSCRCGALTAPLGLSFGTMARMIPATLAALSIISTAFKPADAQAPPPCDLGTLFSHLGDIQGMCCSDGNECSSGYPGADDACSRECGELFEPFWDSEFYSLGVTARAE